MTTIVPSEAGMYKQTKHATSCVAMLITTVVRTDSPVVAVTSKCGLMTLERILTAKQTTQMLPARGIRVAVRSILFSTLVTDFSTKTAVLHKHINIAFGTGVLECIVEPEQNDEIKWSVEANVVHQIEVENCQTQIWRLQKVEHEDAE